MAKFTMFGAVLLAVIVVHGVCAQFNSTNTTNSTNTANSTNTTNRTVLIPTSSSAGQNTVPGSGVSVSAKATVVVSNPTYVTMASSVTGNHTSDPNDVDKSTAASGFNASASVSPTNNTTKRSSGNQNKGSLSVSFLLFLVGMAFYHIPN